MSSKTASEGRPWSLALRLTLWYALAAFALVLTATGYLYFALVSNLDREDDQFLTNQARRLQTLLHERADDPEALQHEVETPAGSRELGRFLVRVLDGDRVRVETPGMNDVLPASAVAALGAGDRRQDVEARDGREFRLLVRRDDGTGVTIHAAMDRAHEAELLEDYRRHLAYVLGLSLMASAAGGYLLARSGLHPVKAITATARRIGPAELEVRVATAGLPAELRELADTMNHMLDRIADSHRRLAQFSADLAHEMRTPVNNLRGTVEVSLGRARTPEEYHDVLGSCLEECLRLGRLIEAMLFLARAENPRQMLQRQTLDLRQELVTVREFYNAAAEEAGVRLDVAGPPGLVLQADRSLLQRAVGNLVTNALSHTPAGGTVTLSAAHGPRVEVADTGRGIDPADLPHVLDRLYRGDRSRTSAGSGLGLAIVKTIAELHGGRVTIESEVGRGTRVSILWETTQDR